MPFLSEKISPYWGFARFVLERFSRDRCNQVAASLTYTTLLSLVPLVTIALTVFSAFPVFGELMIELKIFLLTTLVPEKAGKIITIHMQQFSDQAAGLTMVGVAFLGVTASMLMYTIEQVFNAIWRVRQPRPLIQRFLVFWALLTLGPLLLGASLSLTSYLVGLSFGWTPVLSAAGVAALKAAQMLLTVAAFSLLYAMVPNRSVAISHALAGGVLAGLLFEGMKRGFALYVTHFPTYTLIYGAFAAIPIFLLWIYLSWLVVLAGAEVAASLSYWRGGVWRVKDTPGRRFYDALRMLAALHDAQHQGEPVSLQRLRRQVSLGFEEMEDVLERLAEINLARRVSGGGWVACRNLDEVKVSEIYRCFVISSEGTVADGLPPAVRELGRRWDEAMDLTLHQLFASGDAPPHS